MHDLNGGGIVYKYAHRNHRSMLLVTYFVLDESIKRIGRKHLFFGVIIVKCRVGEGGSLSVVILTCK